MALPTSGAISVQDLVDEFGGPYDLTSYYRGGTYVPDIPANSSVPTSGPITIPDDFYGAESSTVTLSGHTITSSGQGTQVAQVIARTDGTMDENTTSGGTAQIDSSTDWIRPTSEASSSHEIYCEVLTGSVTGDSTGTWLAMTADRSWSRSSTSGLQTASIRLHIRYNGGSTLNSGDYSLEADSF